MNSGLSKQKHKKIL